MSAFSTSHCPLCRADYVHFPAVAWKVHNFLEATFPHEYTERAKDNAEEEEEQDCASPDPPAGTAPSSSNPGNPALQDFTCDVCSQMLYQPTILNCGHVVCHATCVGATPNSSCGACGHPVLKWPEICKQLSDLLASAFPMEQAQRALQVADHLARIRDSAAQQAEKSSGQELEDPMSGAASPLEPPPAGSAGTAGQASETAAIPGENYAPPQLQPSANQTPTQGINAAVLESINGKNYAHFGIGCDSCGVYPIVGRRFKCTDCPESVGFDLCGDCHDRGIGNTAGRFNQRHTTEHEMIEVRPRVTSLHVLRAANPELPFEQLMALIEMAENLMEEQDEEEEEQEEGGIEVEEEEEAELDVGEEVDEVDEEMCEELRAELAVDTADDIVQQPAENREEDREEDRELVEMPMRRGPRPAPDPTAQWPSPSMPGFTSDARQGDYSSGPSSSAKLNR